MRAILPGLLVLATLSACGSEAKPATRIEMPARPTDKVVVYVHGSGETADALDAPDKQAVFAALRRQGYALAAADAGGEAWGNPESVRAYRDLLSDLRGRGLTRVYLLAQSMGGVAAMKLADQARAVAAIFPVCDLASVATKYDRAIRDAYRGRVPRPVVRARRGEPMRFWSSPSDTIVPKAANTDVCAAAARARGARVTVTTTRGDHGDPSNFDAGSIVRLFNGS